MVILIFINKIMTALVKIPQSKMFRCAKSTRGLIQWRKTIHVGLVRLLSAPTVDDKSTEQARWNLDALQEADVTPTIDLASEGTEVAKTVGDVVLTGWSPVRLAQYFLEVMHVSTGLPWWATIAATTVVVRLALTPVVVRLQANAVKINNLRPEIDPLLRQVQEARRTGNTALATTVSARMMSLYQKHDCNPMKMVFMPFIQIPIFITFFITLRRMTELPVAGMSSGGMFWFQNLTVPDSYYALPVLASLSFMTIMQIGGEAGVSNPQMDKMKNIMRIMAVAMIPVSATFPSGLFMYWITSSLFSIAQVSTLRVPKIRRALGIPPAIVYVPKKPGNSTDSSNVNTKRKTNTR